MTPHSTQSWMLLIGFMFAVDAPAQDFQKSNPGGGVKENFMFFNNLSDKDRHNPKIEVLGDIDGDGIDDFLWSNPDYGPVNSPPSGVVVLYSGATQNEIYRIVGSLRREFFGHATSAIGDINNDGYPDFICSSFVSVNPATGPARTTVYSGLTGTPLYRIMGASNDEDWGLSSAGTEDLNGDGVPDFLIGSPGNSSVLGSVTLYSGANGSVIRRHQGNTPNDSFGVALASLKDLDGDSVSDYAVGVSKSDPNGRRNAGSVILYSGATGSVIRFWHGSRPLISFGATIEPAGDVNADGFEDLLIGAPGVGAYSDTRNGVIFVYSGKDGELLYKYKGIRESSYLGRVFSGVGDVNMDGHDDFLIGNPKEDCLNCGSYFPARRTGAAYLMSGATGALLQRFSLRSLGRSAAHSTPSYTNFGHAVSPAGDLNGDGRPDFLIGSGGVITPLRIEEGVVFGLSFDPFLTQNTPSISITQGGTNTLSMDFPSKLAFLEYRTLMSLRGPGSSNFGIEIPLLGDDLTRSSFLNQYPFLSHSGLHGTLDAQGNATASFQIGPGTFSGLIGSTIWLTVVTARPGRLTGVTSIALPVRLTQ